MVGCLKYNTMLDNGWVYADTIAELKNLPTLTENGKAQLSNMNSIKVGSFCGCREDSNRYVLTGKNKWEIYCAEGGGGGGGADWPDGYETEDIDFTDWEDY